MATSYVLNIGITNPYVKVIIAKRKAAREAAEVLGAGGSPVRPERLMAELDTVLGPRDIVVADASYSSVWVANYLHARAAGQRFLSPRGMAGLGWGLPMALGAKLARAEANVFCLAGDGGFAHVWSELETSRRHGLKVILTVLNNGVLGYQRDAEDVLYKNHTTAVELAPIDHAAVARACGLKGVRVERGEDYGAALAEAIAAPETTLIDVITDPAAYPPITFYERKIDH